MATWENTDSSARDRTRPGGATTTLVLAAIAVILTLSLLASHATVTRLQRQTARLQTDLNVARAAVSDMNLRIVAARGIVEGPFERVRDHVVAKTAARILPGS